MMKSATDVMQEIVYAAVVDALAALKAASRGMPNTLLRDLNAIHANSTFADLPRELQASITASVRAAFTRLLREGYSVSSGQAAPAARPPATGRPAGPGGGSRPPGPRRDRPGSRPPPRQGNRPSRKPKPRAE